MPVIDNPDIGDAEFAQFQKLIYKIAGISLADTEKVLLVGRLGRRLKHFKLSRFADYYRLVASGAEPDELQTMVDLLPALGKFHVIFLRNVMIYFDADTKRQVVARLIEHLHPGGYFIVGHSESLNGLTDALRPLRPTIYQLPV